MNNIIAKERRSEKNVARSLFLISTFMQHIQKTRRSHEHDDINGEGRYSKTSELSMPKARLITR